MLDASFKNGLNLHLDFLAQLHMLTFARVFPFIFYLHVCPFLCALRSSGIYYTILYNYR